MPTFSRQGVTFHYLDEGSGVPLVFQHGLGGDVGQPRRTLGTPGSVRLLSLDCRGHGLTRPLGPPNELTFNTFADDVSALLEHAAVPRAVVGGISMGAGVALNLAVRFPERVAALVLVRPAWLGTPDPPHLAPYTLVARLIRQYGAAEALARFETSAAYVAVRRASPAASASLLDQFTRDGAEAHVDVLERLPADTPAAAFGWRALQTPTLVVGTRRDPNHPLGLARTLAREIPSATFCEATPRDEDAGRYGEEVRHSVLEFTRQAAIHL